MNKQCPRCQLNNPTNARTCVKCRYVLVEGNNSKANKHNEKSLFQTILRRAVICLLVVIFTLFGFYISLVFSAKSLTAEEKATVNRAVKILEDKGFKDEVFYLKYLTVFRSNDNWLNASVIKENAYAATNYPFEIMTLYPDFFTHTIDDTERAAILLHEAKHLQGFDEKIAYEFVWKNKSKFGWTKENYKNSVVWRDVRKQTRDYLPDLFICDFNEFDDCTQ